MGDHIGTKHENGAVAQYSTVFKNIKLNEAYLNGESVPGSIGTYGDINDPNLWIRATVHEEIHALEDQAVQGKVVVPDIDKRQLKTLYDSLYRGEYILPSQNLKAYRKQFVEHYAIIRTKEIFAKIQTEQRALLERSSVRDLRLLLAKTKSSSNAALLPSRHVVTK